MREALRINLSLRGINQSAERCRDAETFPALNLIRLKTASVDDDARRRFFPKTWGHRQMNLRRHEIADLVNRHRALVRSDSRPAAPQRPLDKIVEGALGPLPEAVNTAILPDPVAACGMVVLKLLWVARGPGLRGSEVTSLRNCEFIKTPSRVLGISLRHSGKKVTYIFTFSKYLVKILIEVIINCTFMQVTIYR
ncbi:MAG TPA: hypothetical protein VLT62_31455 [Candidatus Methylomirabilis sp.]|nr:hypothetical protein [Candidatus Methylomirabilis sp.]